MVQSINDNSPLYGVTVLVVEDDCLLAMDLEDMLVGAGAIIADICGSLDEAMARGEAGDFDVAILDFSLGTDCVTPFARQLVQWRIPFVFHTGTPRSELAEWQTYPIVEKSASSQALVSAIGSVVAREPNHQRGRRR